MSWLSELYGTQPIAQAIGVLSIVCVFGMFLGSLKYRGIGLGSAGVLFAGILVGHFGNPVDPEMLDFVKEFGLSLFVFTMGLQLGPGFFANLRQQGMRMNVLAAMIVILGAAGAPLICWLAGFDRAVIPGIFAGASVNMPALGAATQTLMTLPNLSPERLALPALACAVTYPAAIAGSLAAVLVLKKGFRIDTAREVSRMGAERRHAEPLERCTFLVSNTNLEGTRLDELPARAQLRVTISRVRRGSETFVATGSTEIHLNDRLALIGTRQALDQYEHVIGPRCDEDLVLTDSDITSRVVVVTDREVLGQSVAQLRLDERFGVAVTRVTRADLEMTAVPFLRLQFGDQVHLVGKPEDLAKAAASVGNSVDELNETHFIPFFIGMTLGVVLGTMPITIPFLPQPIRLGLAGGPLIVALLLGRIGRIRRQIWHMPVNTNLAFREFGIVLFFATVGLDAGAEFFTTAFSATGLQWLLAGLCVTMIPLLLIGSFARFVWNMNFIDLSGLLAGSMTNPPGLAFASSLVGSSAPSVAYATVYPLTTLLRILSIQVLVLTLMG